MDGFANFVIKRRKLILLLFIIAIIISLFLAPMVKINYELSKYLPAGMASKEGITLTKNEFGFPGTARVMVKNVTIPQAENLKNRIAKVDGVDNVLWLDDVANIYQPLDFIDKDSLDEYYKVDNALFEVYFVEGDSSLRTSAALNTIKDIVGEDGFLAGSAVNTKSVRETTQSQVGKITLFVIPLVFIILLATTTSWFEPVLFMAVIGVSILINMGTNVFLGEVSFLTRSMTTALQLAISMDYSIFLLHRFGEERVLGLSVEEAMSNAVKKSLSSITASALTTIAGFLALILMRFRIGADMGLVFAKGIVFSLVSVIFLLPALTIMFDKYIESTHHRSFLPSFKGLGRFLVRFRYGIILLVIVLFIPSYLAQSSNQYVYGESSITTSKGSKALEDLKAIEKIYGRDNQIVLLFPRGDTARETKMADEMKSMDAVRMVKSIVTLTPPGTPKKFLPQTLLDKFESGKYSRMILTLNTEIETQAAFTALHQIKDIVGKYYPNQYSMTGSTVVADDIKAVVETDYTLVSWISIAAVALIIFLTFRSVSLPIILVTVIEAAIIMNMSVPYFTGTSLAFIGYLIISTIQLGATIDYAILFTNRYLENRMLHDKKTASANAIAEAGPSIATSAGILCISGFIISGLSTVGTISQMGELIGRGALLSGILVFALLSQLLVLFDGIIKKTTLGVDFHKQER